MAERWLLNTLIPRSNLMLPDDERDDFYHLGVPWGPGTSDENGIPWENRNGLYDSLGKDGNLCKSPTLKDILSQRTLGDKCYFLLGFDIVSKRWARIIHECDYDTHEVEVVLRPNENEMRGTRTWKWGGVSQLPECIVVGGKSCQYVYVVWLNESVIYGVESGRAAKWCLLFNDTPDFDDIKPYVKCDNLNQVEMESLDKFNLFLRVVPDFVIHDFWQPEQHPYLHCLRHEWVRALLLMGNRARKLRRVVIGGTPETGLEYALDIALIGKSTMQDVLGLVSLADWQPSIQVMAQVRYYKPSLLYIYL